MELALGTVQFGLRYGIAGAAAPVPTPEARAILQRAVEWGVRVVDTAAAYGDIEERLAGLIEGLPLKVVSKLPPRPAGLDGPALAVWTTQHTRRALQRLGSALTALLFHRAEDLLGDASEWAWAAAAGLTQEHGITLGVSSYSPETLQAVRRHHPVALAQLPGNVFDRSMLQAAAEGCTLHLRSAFLQGLLLLPEDVGRQRLPAAAAALQRWHAWCRERGMSPLVAALGCAKSLPASHCVVGVDSLSQLEEIAVAWQQAPVIDAPELAVTEPAVIDPRIWQVAAS
jgi:aryl-alcohol dehydrogenase-like predicted oxidoreductase